MFIVIPTLPWPPPYTKMTTISVHCQVHHHTTTIYQDHHHIYTQTSSSSNYTIMTTTVYQDDHQTYTGSSSLSHLQRHDHHHNYTKMTTIPVHCQVHCHITLSWSPPYTRMATIPKHGQVRRHTHNMMTNTMYQNDHHTYTLSSSSSHCTMMVTTIPIHITLHYGGHHHTYTLSSSSSHYTLMVTII